MWAKEFFNIKETRNNWLGLPRRGGKAQVTVDRAWMTRLLGCLKQAIHQGATDVSLVLSSKAATFSFDEKRSKG
jgi:hypothetical protein